MNKRQLEVQQVQASEEEKVIRQLKQVYTQARKDCEIKIRELSARTDMQNLQSIVYQKQYQEALKQQLDSILNTLNSNTFTTIADYLGVSYENGFMGTLYDLQGQGIPLIFPINQEEVVRALQVDSKLSEGLYKRLGEDTTYLKKSIRAELSRGASNGESWNQIAAHIANGMNSPFNKAYNNSIRIARTEGHRVQQESTFHCQQRAKSKGADIMKQWDSTLDAKTRPDHVELDGQLREIDKPFEVSGYGALYPGAFGVASEDIHCRCCLLQRARWAISTEDFFDKWNGDKNELVKVQAKTYNEFKKKAKEVTTKQKTINNNPDLKGLVDGLDRLGVAYNQVTMHDTPLPESDIIKALAGGDKTTGSCASVGLAYIGQKGGMNVLDFRGGESQNFFSAKYNLNVISKFANTGVIRETAKASITVGNKLLKKVEKGKQYYMVVGRHASIVRKTDEGVLQYLELQSADRSGWTNFNGNPRYTLAHRFGCGQSRGYETDGFMIDVDQFKDSEDLKILLGYINTTDDKQMKGVGGSVKYQIL